MPVTFGIEEEFVLLDRTRLEAVDLGAEAVAALSRSRGDAADTIVHEFFASQLEHATPVCTGFADAWGAVTGFRRRLAEWADAAGVVAAGSGTPFRVAGASAVTADERYERIAHDIGGLTAEHQINGLHVHVGIPDRDAGVHISNGLRPWLPVLLALSANSPFWHGRDTEFDSWRTIHSRRWTTYGIPPLFRDAADYDHAVASLRGLGATSDPGTINWSIRLSPRLPTVEVRVCDAQLDPDSAVALALIVRALAEAALASAPVTFDATPWDAALWHAARHGLRVGLLHPLTGRPATAAAVVQALGERVAPRLADAAERDAVERLLTATLVGGNGATRQRAAKRRGIPALAELYRSLLSPRDTAEPPRREDVKPLAAPFGRS
jgi:carboxylate-amine ligase